MHQLANYSFFLFFFFLQVGLDMLVFLHSFKDTFDARRKAQGA